MTDTDNLTDDLSLPVLLKQMRDRFEHVWDIAENIPPKAGKQRIELLHRTLTLLGETISDIETVWQWSYSGESENAAD